MATKYWTRVIARAKERKKAGKDPFTRGQVDRAACSWTTCACGKQDPLIPRRGWDGKPEDFLLTKAGIEFGSAVEDQNPVRAGLLLARIEKRAAEVLRKVAGSSS